MENDLRRWMRLMETRSDDDDDEYQLADDDESDEPYQSQPAYRFQQELDAVLKSSGLDAVCEVTTRETDRETVELYQITTKIPDRRQGHANRAMEIVTSLADKFNVWITLEAAANMDDQGMSSEQLARWYDQWGFDKTSQGMMRQPGA